MRTYLCLNSIVDSGLNVILCTIDINCASVSLPVSLLLWASDADEPDKLVVELIV